MTTPTAPVLRRRRRSGRPGPTPGRPGLRRRPRARRDRRQPGGRLRRGARRRRGRHGAGRPRVRRARARPRRASPPPSSPTSWPSSPARWPGGSRCGGSSAGWAAPAADFLAAQRDPAVLAGLAATEGPRHLGEDFELVRETFHRFAEDKVRPHAEHVHRENGDIPEEVIEGLAELGGFGLSVPEEYGGFASGGESDYMGMVVATEELSWGSLGVGGSLITRPEILTRALVYGGHRGAEEALAPQAGLGRDPGRRRGDRARLRVRRRRHRHLGHAGRGRLGGQRRQDLVHLRRPGRRADAAGPHRPRPLPRPPRHLHVRRREAARRRPRLRLHAGRTDRTDRATWRRGASRAGPSTRSATAACTPTSWPSRTGSCPRPTSSAARTGWARASTSRCRASRTAGCRRRRARSASCRPPTRRRRRTPPSARCSDRPSASTS